jgi:hypothetical protein
MSDTTEGPPVAVPARARPTGEAPGRRLRVEPTVGTERLLTALDQGVKAGHAFFAEQGVFHWRAAHALAVNPR